MKPAAECSIKGCGRLASPGGLCATHTKRKQRGLPLDAPVRPYERQGQYGERGCKRKATERQRCHKHVAAFRRRLMRSEMEALRRDLRAAEERAARYGQRLRLLGVRLEAA